LLHNEESIALPFLQWLCCNPNDPPCFVSQKPTITTQWSAKDGRPDIRIAIPSALLVLVEVKKDSEMGATQLERYWKILKESGVPFQRLVLLTVYPAVFSENNRASKHVKWPDVAEWMKKHLPRESVSKFLVDQFLDFMMGQGMTMEQVNWELVNGAKAYRHLIIMLYKAIERSATPYYAKATQWNEFFGYYLEAKQFSVAVSFTRPTLVRFAFVTPNYDKKVFDSLGTGRVDEFGPCWALDLASEEAHFFCRSADSQLELLTDWLKKVYQDAKTCLVGKPPPQIAPVEPEPSLVSGEGG
jgi:hypothetical protein